ncbi:hypothetical protein DUZ99_04315 [Xylanibacillus composti]|uniref:DUF3052 domain-containing protein n=1 Tax=Xylanibacillus composti TaxID=1572762 RepID=A0A8J4H408_9BACL|nr:hypothetical protein [Xylanibacillus composti]MDT9724212.1 hypothetical protein [Xylanibacillus composti]GIQ68273.1 hypothetical protein XYCOK13_10970 [Xylanibacillus composti]
MSTDLVKKLHYKGGKALLLNAPETFAWTIEASAELEQGADFILLFARNAEEVEQWKDKAAAALAPGDSILWLAYPKKSSKMKSDIHRDLLWDTFASHQLRPVSQVSLDETWSALRYRHEDRVKKKST